MTDNSLRREHGTTTSRNDCDCHAEGLELRQEVALDRQDGRNYKFFVAYTVPQLEGATWRTFHNRHNVVLEYAPHFFSVVRALGCGCTRAFTAIQ